MMTMTRNAIRNAAFSAVLIVLPFGSALAQDATAIADRLKASAAGQGIDIAWTNVSGDATSMILEGVTVKALGETEALPIGNVTLSGVAEANGGYIVETLTTSPFSKSEEGLTLDLSALVVKGMQIPAEGATDPLSSMAMYQTAELASMTVKMAGKTAFSMQGLAFEITPPADGKPMEFTGAVEKFSTDLSLIEDPDYKSYIDAFGYSQLDGFVEMAGSWQPTDGHWTLTQNDISIKDVGTLGLTADLGGFTPGFLTTLNDLTRKMEQAPDGSDTSADDAALMGLMQQATFNGATIRFNDDTLTDRAFGFVARQQGAKPADVKAMAKATLPFALMHLQLGDFAAAISPAVNAFLDNPQSIEIKLAPPAPVTFAKIGEASAANPGESAATTNALWSLLGVTVTANQK